MNTLIWDRSQTPEELVCALKTLADEYPLSEGDGANLAFRKDQLAGMGCTDSVYSIAYNQMSEALRGVGLALAGLAGPLDNCIFHTFGVMVDCSRNAVMTVEYGKSLLRRLALMGYNRIMFYTEDTYELEDEPHFGFLRGAYSAAEIRELDDYAYRLGIELCGCIQTLGHLEIFLRSAGTAEIRDTSDIMLVDEEKTYELIRKMVRFWHDNCRSRNLHIGMDEAHNLGRGKFLDKYGYQNNFEIFNRHLNRVNAICSELNMNPMIWSDMYFRMGSETGDYYDLNTDIPADVRKCIPPECKLVYWDYYHLDSDFYDKMIEQHRNLGKEPVVGSGLWTWYRLFYDHRQTADRVLPCIDSCRKNKIGDFFFTMWGDNGAYCNFPSVYAGLAWGAESAYGQQPDADRLEALSAALKLPSYKETLRISEMNHQIACRDNGVGTLSILLWDDPILKKGWRHLKLDDENIRSEFMNKLEAVPAQIAPGTYFHLTGRLLSAKMAATVELENAYRRKDLPALQKIRQDTLPEIIRLYEEFIREFRNQWKSCYKLNGLETIQIRIGGLLLRYRELILQLEEFEKGIIPEITGICLQSDSRCNPSRSRYLDYAVTGGH